jgi:type IX secretion system PorP/SprF family membrane protein
MNKFLTVVLILTLSTVAYTQQIPLFTQYREAQGVINPASINYDFITDQHKTSFGVSIRRQWSDITGSPTTQILRGEHYMADRTGVTILAGGYLMNDQTGPTGFTGFYGRFATVFTQDPEYSGLSIGLAAGGVQYRVKTSGLKLLDPTDIRAMTDRMQIYPDLGIGAYYYQRMEGAFDGDYFYGGLSVPQLMGLDIQFPKDDNGQFGIRRIQHYFGNIGWYHYITDNSFIEPSAWVKYTPGAPINIDLNARYQMGSNFWLGIGTSLKGNLHAEMGFILGKSMGLDKNFKFGYGYDYSFQSFGPYIGTTHELNLSYSF